MAAIILEFSCPMITSVPRALVVDDHPIVADAMATAITGMRIFDRVDSANSLPEACTMLEENPVCNLAVVDLHLRDMEGRATLTGLRERFPEVPVLVFSGDESLESITMAFECGARGYVTKGTPMKVVASAIRLVLAGGSYIPQEAAEIIGFSAPAQIDAMAARGELPIQLSGRQQQVMRLLLQGMPDKVIGARLAMAEGTVKAHLNTVFRVLGVHTRVEAILRARQLGIL